MHPRNVVFPAGHAQNADVGTPQVGNLVQPSYHSEMLSDKVSEGRAKSALNSEQVPDCHLASEAPHEGWSRGCRRAHVSFWFWQWFRLSPLAPRKKSRCPSRSPRKCRKPASTSKHAGRACLPWHGRPAPTPRLLHDCAVDRPLFLDNSASSLWALPGWSPISPAVCHDKGQVRC